MKKLLILSLVIVASQSMAFASDCSLGIFKTYIPHGNGRVICDDQKLPATFANNLSPLIKELKQMGYKASRYDQCTLGSNDKNAYSLVSQLGSCIQKGVTIKCKLFVALYENKSNDIVYSNTIESENIGSVSLHLSEAIESMPACK